MKITTNGRRQIIAKTGSPAVKNSYMAKENRRKSKRTLPPFSWVNSDILFE